MSCLNTKNVWVSPSVGGKLFRGCDCQLACKLDPGNRRFLKPMAYTINNTENGHSFSVTLQRKPIKLLTRRVLKYHHHSYELLHSDLGQVLVARSGLWTFMHLGTLTLGYGHLCTWAPSRWKQKNRSKQNQPNCIRDMGWTLLEMGSHSVTLRDSN